MSEQPQTPEQQTHDALLVQQASTALNDSLDEIDAATRSQLNQMRHRALEEKSSAWQRMNLSQWGAAAVCTLAVTLWLGQTPNPILPSNEAEASLAGTSLPLLQEDLEMLEDLDMLFWLAEIKDTNDLG